MLPLGKMRAGPCPGRALLVSAEFPPRGFILCAPQLPAGNAHEAVPDPAGGTQPGAL